MPTHPQVDPAWLASQLPNITALQPLDTGGQKQVFSAKHSSDGDVVLKLMHPGADPERTARELLAAAQVNAPRVPRIYEHGQLTGNTGPIVWFREQRIPGEALNKRVLAAPLTPSEVMRLSLHVSETLVAAELARIVHRDVKPANIIVDPNGNYWLIDFGFARHLDLDSITATAAPGGCGTPGYAPIEQCRNDKKEIDARADLFALGVTLYESATGINPHRQGARDVFEIMARVSKNHLPRLADPIPREFSDLVATLAQPNAIHRCQTAREAREWINDVCVREGVR